MPDTTMPEPTTPEPTADRPDMPEGYLGNAPLPWAWAEAQLVAARSYWVTTIGASGRPHVRPVWGIWQDGTFQFSTGAGHARNIARDPRVTVNLDDADECVILEGTAEASEAVGVRRAFAAAYEPKYEWKMPLASVDAVYVVRPIVVFGWFAHDIAPGETLFQATATRWRFPA